MLLISLLVPPVNVIRTTAPGSNDLEEINCSAYVTNIGGNLYCDIRRWRPRISKTGGLAAILVPTFVAALPMGAFLGAMGLFIIKDLYGNHKDDKEYRKLDCGIPGTRLKYSIPLPRSVGITRMVVSLILMPIFKVIWDVIDVAADGYYFQQLETGDDLLDAYITRDTDVNNAIMAFAVLGALKSVLLGYGYTWLMMECEDEYEDKDSPANILIYCGLHSA